MFWKFCSAALAAMFVAGIAGSAEAETRFLQQPDISATMPAALENNDSPTREQAPPLPTEPGK
mgnify:CR=1 FL=1